MHVRSVRPVGLLAFVALLGMGLASCATAPRSPVVVLPNGYYLKPVQGTQSQIVKRGNDHPVVGLVAAYAVSRNIVAGAMGKAPTWAPLYQDDKVFTGGPATQYFILDTESGKLEGSLTASAWHARLKDLGVPSDFQIYPPLPWHEE